MGICSSIGRGRAPAVGRLRAERWWATLVDESIVKYIGVGYGTLLCRWIY